VPKSEGNKHFAFLEGDLPLVFNDTTGTGLECFENGFCNNINAHKTIKPETIANDLTRI
jgi:hypothetical protein